jgi:hypothetical protein
MAVEAEKSFCVLRVHEMKLLATVQRQFRQTNGKILLCKAIRASCKRFINIGCVCVCVCVCVGVYRSQTHGQRETARLLFNIPATRQTM